MFSPYTWGSKGGGRPAQSPLSPDAPDITVGPADALGQPRNPSSAASNTGGNAVSANVPANNRGAAAPAFGYTAILDACISYLHSLIPVLISAGGPHGSLHVFHFVKYLLELFVKAEQASSSWLDCLAAFVEDGDVRVDLLESILMALSTEGAAPADIVAQLVDIVKGIAKDIAIDFEPAVCAAPASAASASFATKIPTDPDSGAPPPACSPGAGLSPTPGGPGTSPGAPSVFSPGVAAHNNNNNNDSPGPPSVNFTPDQFSQLLSAFSASTTAGRTGGAEVVADGRANLLKSRPMWFCDPAPAHAGSGALALPGWRTAVTGAPVSKEELRLNVNSDSKSMTNLLKSSYNTSTYRATGAWTTARAAFVSGLANLYVSTCILSMMAATAFVDAAASAQARVHEHVMAAASALPGLGSTVVAARRVLIASGPETALFQFLAALDSMLMPSRLDSHSRWQTLAVNDNETGGTFIRRVYDLKVELDKSDREALLQLETCLEKAGEQKDSNPTVLLMLTSLLQSTTTLSELLEQSRRNRPLFDRVLVCPSARPPAHTGALLGGGATLATGDGKPFDKPLRQAYDHPHAAKIFKEKTGKLIPTDVPPGPYKNCVFCQGIFGKTLIPYDEAKPGRPPSGSVYEHNPFRCPVAPAAADKFCAAHGIAKDDFLKPIDNLSGPICEALAAAAQ